MPQETTGRCVNTSLDLLRLRLEAGLPSYRTSNQLITIAYEKGMRHLVSHPSHQDIKISPHNSKSTTGQILASFTTWYPRIATTPRRRHGNKVPNSASYAQAITKAFGKCIDAYQFLGQLNNSPERRYNFRLKYYIMMKDLTFYMKIEIFHPNIFFINA